MLREVEIECLPEDLVAEIEFDLGLIATPEDVVYVRDLVAPKGVEILADPDTVVASFEYTTIEETEEEEGFIEGEESAEDVEVISRGKKEEEDF